MPLALIAAARDAKIAASMALTLVILAAGIGRRYGGPKQIDRVGPAGATLLDYAVYDAARAGFERVILVVREGMERDVREAVGERIARRLPVAYAIQEDALPAGFVPPPGRSKPWGTGHATLAAVRMVDGPFAVINADDFYGAGSYRVLARFLAEPRLGAEPRRGVDEFALVGFPLAVTLSPDGPVSRGVCEVDERSDLVSIREVLRIEQHGADGRYLDEHGASHTLPGATPVSLNFWGFTPRFAAALEAGFARFLERHAGSTTAEYFLPSAVQDLVATGEARVRVLAGGGPWCGLTYPGDRPRLVSMLESMVARGEYPREI